MIFAIVFIGVALLLFLVGQYFTRARATQDVVNERLATVAVRRTVTPDAPALAGQSSYAAYLQWADRNLNGPVGSKIKRLLEQAHSSTPPGTFCLLLLGLVIAAFALTAYLTANLYIASPVAVAVGSLPLFWLLWRRKRRLTAFDALLPGCLETFSRSLRAGHSIASALSIVAEYSPEPAKSEFLEVVKKQSYGLTLRDALTQMVERVPSTDLRIMVTGILVQSDTGGNLPEVFDRLVEVMRSRMKVNADIKTHTAQGKMTGVILCIMPPVLLFAINAINPNFSDALFHDVRGQHLLLLGIGLLLMGGLTIYMIIREIEV